MTQGGDDFDKNLEKSWALQTSNVGQLMGIISTGGEGGESVGADLSYLQFQGTIAPPLAWPHFLTHGWKINDIGFACISLF